MDKKYVITWNIASENSVIQRWTISQYFFPTSFFNLLCVVFWRSLSLLLSFLFWSLHCLSFFDLRLLITPLVSSNFSEIYFKTCIVYKRPYDMHIINICRKRTSRLRFPVSRLLTDFVCLLIYEFWLSLWKIALCSVILLLPLFNELLTDSHYF